MADLLKCSHERNNHDKIYNELKDLRKEVTFKTDIDKRAHAYE